MQAEFKSMRVEYLAAGKRFLVAHAVHVRYISAHTLIK